MMHNSPPSSPNPLRPSRRRPVGSGGSPHRSGHSESHSRSGRMRDAKTTRSHSLGRSGQLRARSRQLAAGGHTDSDTAASNQDLLIADDVLQDAALVPTQTPSDAVVVPANPSFPSDSKSAALRSTRRALAALPFNIKRGARRASASSADPGLTPNHNSVELPSPRNHSRGLPSATAETPATPSPPAPRPVVSFRSYKQFRRPRTAEIQAAGSDFSMPPPPAFTHSNPLADPSTPTTPTEVSPMPADDMYDMPEVSLQELAGCGHSRHASMHDSDDGGKEKRAAAAAVAAALTPDEQPDLEPSSFAYGRLQSESTMMGLETAGSTMTHAALGSTDGSSLPMPTREWRPRRERSASRLSMGAEQRPGRHRYTYGNESIRARQSVGSVDESVTPPSSVSAPRPRMVRNASNVSLVSAGTPLELKGDYESSFMVNDADDKQQRGVLSKLSPYDSVNVRPLSYHEEGTRSMAGGLGPPRSLGPMDGGEPPRREWVPRHKRSKSKLELGSVRSDGSGFAYSFMYGIGSEHEAVMQDALRAGRKLREERRQQRRLERASPSPRYLSPSPSRGRWAGGAAEGTVDNAAAALCDPSALRAVRTGDGSFVESAMGALSGMELLDTGGREEVASYDENEDARVGPPGSKGVMNFGGFQMSVGPTFKQYRFPISRGFRFSDGLAVPVPLERAV